MTRTDATKSNLALVARFMMDAPVRSTIREICSGTGLTQAEIEQLVHTLHSEHALNFKSSDRTYGIDSDRIERYLRS